LRNIIIPENGNVNVNLSFIPSLKINSSDFQLGTKIARNKRGEIFQKGGKNIFENAYLGRGIACCPII
jgi:hypothetical protein